MDVGEVQSAVAALRAAHDALAALSVEGLTAAEILGVLDDLETLTCQLPVQGHRLLTRLQAETTPKALGAKSWRDVAAIRWRISPSEAGRRLEEAALLASRQTLIGAPLDPVLPCTAIAQSHGLVNREHVAVLANAMSRIPPAVDATTRGQIEADLVKTAMSVGPKQLKDNADRTIFLLDQDGPEPDDTERARRRGVSKAPQQPDGMVRIKANLTPEAWAVVAAVFAKLAAPGMCNPDDEHPCVSGTPSQQQIDDDHRTLAQRQHDALMTAGRSVLESGELGRHNGLPATIVIRTTLQDLESRAGVGVTGGGTVMPIRDVIGLAARAHLFLAVFDGATGAALNLFRARRTASLAQRLMLIARDGGCTKPGCTVPAYGSQVHHAARDWADGGQTNVDELALACGPDNRAVGPGSWTTRINADNDVEWIPPPALDTGQVRVNGYHRPERLYRPPDDEVDEPDADIRPAGPEPNAA
ncbi:HNH endonuclease [Mycolicibacterium sp. P1-18]|uniref:HNH endonuclease signature motif containing protein n=1 Tax=Mycolicibacterium sp. P1-18 TaxID=2024615 RepID=UPI0011F344DE|nr:HNH endonuclease signature motif containing protein [Mycolicibacterium sp. P1-18]KAA0096805.1 HNH endonuclease [Mycolicibacterium sp. P1-18]